jgi:two-component system chemotaxis response regulator CheY
MEVHALIVDDSSIMRKLVMRSLLESKLAQFMFSEAKDGLEALSVFDETKMSMIFVDWNMPNMNGVDFVRRVREKNRTVPIVMVTTESTMGKIEEALDQAGADCFIVKPFTTDTLQKKLDPLFERIRASQGASKGGGFFSRLAAKVG